MAKNSQHLSAPQNASMLLEEDLSVNKSYGFEHLSIDSTQDIQQAINSLASIAAHIEKGTISRQPSVIQGSTQRTLSSILAITISVLILLALALGVVSLSVWRDKNTLSEGASTEFHP